LTLEEAEISLLSFVHIIHTLSFFSLLHEFNDTSADERLRVRVTHGHKHVLADGDAAAPFRKYGRVVLQAAHPHQQ
jgi:hypothetical protein